MWDIKEEDCKEMRSSSKFHLNHVGYKGQADWEKSKRGIAFHLNHVGYKETTF
ncbi:hypothetical protein A45J_1850 [hot springs metagenome]|uniref:Uncharacterized protein n=1 Tax=hot springs metagenome TaxID=433727 RepID=A0A5J4L4B0_9ZZZZ